MLYGRSDDSLVGCCFDRWGAVSEVSPPETGCFVAFACCRMDVLASCSVLIDSNT